MTCCNHNCREGRDCPNRKPMDFGALWRYVCGYVSIFVRYRDHAASKRSGHLASITPREPISGEAKFLIGALLCTWAIVAALYRFDSLVLLWPRMVAALSN